MLVVETVGRIRRERFAKGKTIKEIARDLEVSRNTIRRVLRSVHSSALRATADYQIIVDLILPYNREAVPPPRPAVLSGRRAQGPSSLAVASTSPLAQRFQARLDGTEHGATLEQVGARFRPVPAS
jgi:transcriptional regulator with XRE-family HTH domain